MKLFISCWRYLQTNEASFAQKTNNLNIFLRFVTGNEHLEGQSRVNLMKACD